MVELRPITEANFSDIIRLSVCEAQKEYVATNVYSLAQAWLYDNARPYAIYAEDEPVGFCMLDINPREKQYGVWRFMIDERYQSRGYGSEAMRRIIEVLQAEGAEEIRLSFVEGNERAKRMYESLGFKSTGEIEDGEIVMSRKSDPA